MRLGVIARAVIIVSCFWMAGGTFYIATNTSRDAENKADAAYKYCTSVTPAGYDCWKGRDEVYRAHTSEIQGGLWGFAAASAAIILALGLLASAILYGSIRWVAAGRKARETDHR